MKIVNLSGSDIPALQGVENVTGGIIDRFESVLADRNLTVSHIGSSFRSVPFGHSLELEYSGDPVKAEEAKVLQKYVHDQEPWLIVLPKDQRELAEMLCFLQVGPTPGTEFALLIPVEARNRQWYFAGTKSEIKVPIIFEIDQNGNVVGLSNFVHRTPPITGAQI